MNSFLDVQLKENMRKYLDTFFLSLQGDTTSLSSFISTLSGFNNVIRSQHDKLQLETLVAVQGFVSVLDNVALNVLELEKKTENLGDQTLADITRILAKKMSDLTLKDEQTLQDTKFSKAGNTSQFPAYIKPSCEWLLSNLHNPYPSKELKRSIARESKCSIRDIDAWFIDARKRIGWNSLRRDHFSNKQEKIIAAATRFFQPSQSTFSDDLSASLDSEAESDDVYHAKFTAMENAARSLYSGRFMDVSSGLSLNLSSRKVSTTSTKSDGKRKRASSLESTHTGSEPYRKAPSPVSTQDPVFSYPTPESSPEHVESSPFASVPLSLPIERSTQSRKRRQMSVEPPEPSAREVLFRPPKRSRAGPYEPTNTADSTVPANLPSPAPTVDPSEDTSESTFQQRQSTGLTAPVVVAKRKRRLSDGNSQRPTKRPHHALAVPRLQAVSDPFPISRPITDDSFDNWFNGNFSADHQLSGDIPSPSNFEALDIHDNVPVEVHCHCYDISPYQPDVALPETPFLAHVSHEGLLSKTSIHDQVSKMSTHKNLPIPNSLPDVNAAEVISSGEFSLALDFNFPSAVEETAPQDISFNLLDSIINFDPLVQALPVNFNWMQFPLGDSIDLVEPSTSYIEENPDFDSSIHKGSIIPEDQDAKRLRVQFLKEELKLLESEIGA